MLVSFPPDWLEKRTCSSRGEGHIIELRPTALCLCTPPHRTAPCCFFGLCQDELRTFLSSALLRIGGCISPGSAVHHCRIAQVSTASSWH